MSRSADDSRDLDRKILPADWEALAPMLDALLDTPSEDRAAMLVTLSGGNAARLVALGEMLEQCERDAPLLDRTAFERFDELVEDSDEALPPILSDRYQRGRELGRGGMARVYLARDLKHGRDVALKVIRPELAASLGRERFLREIAIAARLRHPNIVPLFDSGDDAGALYFVMPFEAGPSLRERMRGGPLPLAEALGVLRDVARALAYAHQEGVVHRDVKPDNVMLSSGAAVVTDFGIARAVRAAQGGLTGATLAHTGAFGTPAYMAPEQATGGSSDHRVDIYSFGCMAFELLAGTPPFLADSADELLVAHATKVPPLLSDRRSGLPPGLVRLIGRCLAKRPEERPPSAAELIAELDTFTPPAPAPALRRRRAVVAAVVVVALVASAGWVLAARRDRVAAMVPTGPATVAVLPFTSIGGDSAHTMVAEGLAGEIASELVKVPWVRIMSRRGVSNYAGQHDLDYRETGRQLAARYLLTGVVRETPGHVLVSLQLISAADGGAIWEQRFDRPPAELEAQRDEIAQAIATTLRPFAGAELSGVRAARPAEHRTSGDAYFYRVQAQQWLDRRGTRIQSSADYFRKAIAVDTNYAEAFSGLSLALALYPYFQDTPPWIVRAELIAAALRALALDSTLAQPHVALGMAYEQNNEWDRAGTEFTTALRLDTHDVEARVQYGRYLLYRARTNDALAQFQAAQRDDPASALVLSFVSYAWYLLGQRDSAQVTIDRALSSNPSSFTALNFGALIQLNQGHPVEARAIALRSRQDWPSINYVLAATSPADSTRARLGAMLARRPRMWMINTVRAYSMLGLRDTSRALDALEDATRAREIWPVIEPRTNPIFESIRDTPRFRKLLVTVGLGDEETR